MIAATLTTAQPVEFEASGLIGLSATPWRRIWLSERDGVWCLVDATDYSWLSENTWNISWGSRTPWQHYAKRNIGPERATVRMHREIMERADPRSPRFMRSHHVDHGNGQTLDNRRDNLDWVTNRQNAGNRRPRGQIPSLDSIVRQLIAELGTLPQLAEVPF